VIEIAPMQMRWRQWRTLGAQFVAVNTDLRGFTPTQALVLSTTYNQPELLK
jgi:hypothetical protein